MPAAAETLPSEQDRLIATGKLWITVKYFHPLLAHSAIDWDGALTDSLPKIRAAATMEQYQAAVNALLAPLADDTAKAPTANERRLLYHGLAPETGDATQSTFYPAFVIQPVRASSWVDVPMGGFAARVRLAEDPVDARPPALPPAKLYPEPLPSPELRILAAYKIWGVFHYFFAYRDLMDEDWDALLAKYLARLLEAKDAQDYNLAICEWLTHTTDSAVRARSATLSAYFGEAPVGLQIRIVEKHVVVTAVLDPDAAKAGVKVGDIVKKVDGETLVDKYKRLALYTTGSTPQRLGFDIVQTILNGPSDSNALLTLEDPEGNRKDVTLKRGESYQPSSQVGSDAVRELGKDIGYIDLTRMNTEQALAAFQKFSGKRAVIFDARGDLSQIRDLARLAQPVNSEPDVPATFVTGTLLAKPDFTQNGVGGASSSYFFAQTIPLQQDNFRYTGKTLLLIDERTAGNAERAGAFFQTANKTEFVGAPSAGVVSNVTNFSVPGGITVTLSGEDIRQANGGKLQRLGLQPNVTVAPTVKGVAAGKDEVLERALTVINTVVN